MKQFLPPLLVLILFSVLSCTTGGQFAENGTLETRGAGIPLEAPPAAGEDGEPSGKSGDPAGIERPGSRGPEGSTEQSVVSDSPGFAFPEGMSSTESEKVYGSENRRTVSGVNNGSYLSEKQRIQALLEAEVPGYQLVDYLKSQMRKSSGEALSISAKEGLSYCSLEFSNINTIFSPGDTTGLSGLEGVLSTGFDGSIEEYGGVDIRGRIVLLDLAGSPAGWGPASLALAAEWGAKAVVFLNGGGRFFGQSESGIPAFFLADSNSLNASSGEVPLELEALNGRPCRIIPGRSAMPWALSGSFGPGEKMMKMVIHYSGAGEAELDRFAGETALLIEAGRILKGKVEAPGIEFSIIFEGRAGIGSPSEVNAQGLSFRAGSKLLPGGGRRESRIYGFSTGGRELPLNVGFQISVINSLLFTAEGATLLEDPPAELIDQENLSGEGHLQSELAHRMDILKKVSEDLALGDIGLALDEGLYRLDRGELCRYFTAEAAGVAGLIYPAVLSELIHSLELKRAAGIPGVGPDFAGEISELEFWIKQYEFLIDSFKWNELSKTGI